LGSGQDIGDSGGKGIQNMLPHDTKGKEKVMRIRKKGNTQLRSRYGKEKQKGIEE